MKSQIAPSNGQDVGAVELPGRGGSEANGAGPEILLRIVALQPGADGVAHVEHLARPIRARAQQQVHPGLRQLGPNLDLRQQRTREHQGFADPVGFVDDAQPVRIAVGDEDAEGGKVWSPYIHASENRIWQALKLSSKAPASKALTTFSPNPKVRETASADLSSAD